MFNNSMRVVVIFLIIALLMLIRISYVKREMFSPDDQITINSLGNEVDKIPGINNRLDNLDGQNNNISENVAGLYTLLHPYLDSEGKALLFPKGDIGPKGDKGDIGPAGSVGATGGKGDIGPTGGKGDTGSNGAIGQRGEVGPAGASVFDVSRLMLNGETNLFNQKDNDSKDEPQPSSAYTTLFG
jgi:hypothetical protein